MFREWVGEKGRRGGERERGGFASEGNGVSFRGIDVSQYTPDAVDTPIRNPRPQSLPSRNCVLKVRQGESYSSPSRAVSSPRSASRDSLFNPFSPREDFFFHRSYYSSTDVRSKISINREEERREEKRAKRRENDEGAALSRSFIGQPPPSPHVIGPARRQSAIGQRKRSMNSPRKMYYRAAIIGNTRQDERDNIGV